MASRLRAHRSFLHWNADVSVGLLREWLEQHPAWFGPEVGLIRQALLLDTEVLPHPTSSSYDQMTRALHGVPRAARSQFDYGDGGRASETWADGSLGSNGGDRALLEQMTEEDAAKWVGLQELAFAKLIDLGGLAERRERASPLDGQWTRARQTH